MVLKSSCPVGHVADKYLGVHQISASYLTECIYNYYLCKAEMFIHYFIDMPNNSVICDNHVTHHTFYDLKIGLDLIKNKHCTYFNFPPDFQTFDTSTCNTHLSINVGLLLLASGFTVLCIK